MKQKTFHIPIFVPHKGCPHDCVFCNQRKITGRQKDMTADDAKSIIESHLETIEKCNAPGRYMAEIAFFGGSFTAIDMEMQTELLSLAKGYVDRGRVHGIRCSTRPDSITAHILENCKKYGMTAIELGVQSADEEVLLLSDRGHTFEDVKKASYLIKFYGFELGLQQMTGLPGDTYEKSVETARKIASLEPKAVRIYPTLIMEGTRLWDMCIDGTYTPQTLDYAVNLAADIADIYLAKGIEILRISLQTTDGVNEKTVKGPYHPAFAELVYSEIEKRKIEKDIIANNISDCEYTVKFTDGNVSKIIGHKKSNKIYFKEKYGIDLKVIK